MPHGVTIDAQRRVYVADRDNRRIQIFDENGRYLDEWPDIRGIVFVMATRDQHIWALTGTTNRLLKDDLKGQLLTYWGTANIDPPGPGSVRCRNPEHSTPPTHSAWTPRAICTSLTIETTE